MAEYSLVVVTIWNRGTRKSFGPDTIPKPLHSGATLTQAPGLRAQGAAEGERPHTSSMRVRICVLLVLLSAPVALTTEQVREGVNGPSDSVTIQLLAINDFHGTL